MKMNYKLGPLDCSDSEFNFWNLWIHFGRLVGLLGRGISLTQGPYLHRTAQHKKTQTHTHTHILASSGIRTHDLRVRVVKDRAATGTSTNTHFRI